MKNIIGGDLICKRPETIIEARYSLTKRQNDILDMVFASIQDDDKLKYEIDISIYGQLYNIKDKSNIYRDLKKAVKTFEGKGFAITQKISEKKENRIYFSWFASIQYIDGESKIIVELGQTLKELMLNAKKACFYQIKYPLNFNNTYSKRLYYYLKSYENSNKNRTGWRIDNLDELRAKLECPKSYNRFAEFKRNVIEPAHDEINGDSDISFEYEIIKTKAKATGIKFYIKPNNLNKKLSSETINEIAVTTSSESQKLQQSFDDVDNIKKVQAIFHKHKVTNNEASCILKDADNNLNLVKQCYDYLLTKDKVENVVGYMRKLVKGFNEPQSNKKQSAWDYDGQRTYDFDEMERKIFGWESN